MSSDISEAPRRLEILSVELPSGGRALMEVTVPRAEEDVAFNLPSIKPVIEAIEEIATAIQESLKRVAPRKATVEFGVELGLESGQLTALLVKGTGTATFTVSLEWGDG